MWDRLPGPICCTIRNVAAWLKNREKSEVRYTPTPRKFLRFIKKYRPQVVCYPAVEPDIVNAIGDIDANIVQVYIRHGIGLKVFDDSVDFWKRMTTPPGNIDIILAGGPRDISQYDGLLSEHVSLIPDTWVKFDRFVSGDYTEYDPGFSEERTTILWCPTVGRWSSFEPWFDGILRFFSENPYNLIIKPHSILYSTHRHLISAIKKNKRNNIRLLPQNEANILPVLDKVDLMLSDISSAAVEFFYFNKPIVFLMNEGINENELFYRDMGEIIYKTDDIGEAINNAIEYNPTLTEKKKLWCDKIWGKIDGEAAKRAAAVITGRVYR